VRFTADKGLIYLDLTAQSVRSARTIADRRRCGMYHAVSHHLWETDAQFALRDEAEILFLWFVMYHAAENHNRSGVRVTSRIIPAVCGMTRAQPSQSRRPSVRSNHQWAAPTDTAAPSWPDNNMPSM